MLNFAPLTRSYEEKLARSALTAASVASASAQEADPTLLHDANGLKVRWHFQLGRNAARVVRQARPQPPRASCRCQHTRGLRVPFIARWPGHIATATVRDWPAVSYDVLPTLTEPGEKDDVAARHPDTVKRIAAIMAQEHVPSARFPMKLLDGGRRRVIIILTGDNMLRTQISLDADLYERARAEAARRGISIAELVRRALAAQLASPSPDRPWMRFAGTMDSGDADASTSIDDVVYGRGRP